MEISSIFKQSMDRKKLLQEDQLRKISKSRMIHEQNALNQSTKSQIQPSMVESISSNKSVISSYDQLDKLLSNDLMSFIVNADQSLVEIKDEDIIFDEQQRKRRKQKKNRQNDQQLNSQTDFDTPEVQRKTIVYSVNQSENLEEEKKKQQAKKKNLDQKMMLSNLKINEIDEKPVDDVRDTEIFQYSYENSVDEEYDDEEERIKRKKLIEEKVPIPKNIVQAQDNIIFDILKIQMGDLETQSTEKHKKLLGLFNVDKSRKTISIKTGEAVNGNYYWHFLKQFHLKEKLSQYISLTEDRKIRDVISMDRKHKSLLKIKQNTTQKQLF